MKIGMRTAVVLFFFMLYLHLVLSTASSSSCPSSISAELQEKYHTQSKFVQNTRTGHGGGEGVGARGGSEGDANDESSSTRTPGRPLNGADNVNSRNHLRHGAGIHTSNCNLSMIILFISLSQALFCLL